MKKIKLKNMVYKTHKTTAIRLFVFSIFFIGYSFNVTGQELSKQLDLLQPLIGEWTSNLMNLKISTQYQFILNDKVVKRVNKAPAINQSDDTHIYWDSVKEEIKYFTLTNAGWISIGKVFKEGDLIVFEGTLIKDDNIFRIKNTLKPLSIDKIEDYHYSWDDGWKIQHNSILKRTK